MGNVNGICIHAIGAARWTDFTVDDGHRERDEVGVANIPEEEGILLPVLL